MARKARDVPHTYFRDEPPKTCMKCEQPIGDEFCESADGMCLVCERCGRYFPALGGRRYTLQAHGRFLRTA